MLMRSILSALLVLLAGFLGSFLDLAGLLLSVSAAATGCIVYAIYDSKK